MSQLQGLSDEISHLRQMVEAGRRGRPIGGELLIGLGGLMTMLCLTNALNALRGWPLALTLSPFGALAAFLAFALAVTSEADAARRPVVAILAAFLAGGAAETLWRMMLSAGHGDVAWRTAITILLVSLPLILIGTAMIALWRLRRHMDALSPVNRAMIDIWSGIAAATFLIILFCAIVGWRMNNWFGFMLMPGLVWTLWGAGWWLNGRVSGSRWMSVVALASCAVAIWYGATFDFWVSSVIGFLALVLVPGLLLVRDARVASREA